jgi:CHAT domain-containing protein
LTADSQNSVEGPRLSLQFLGRELDKRLMQPVRKLLGTRKHLLLATDGELNLIPFSALIDERQKFLVERYTVTNLTSGRDLLRLQVKIDAHSPPMILADPDYATGNGPTLFDKQLKPLSRLVGTKQEARIIQTELPDFTVKLGAEATKSVLESVDKPKLLHIATHGYFLENSQPSAQAADQRSLAALTDTPVDFDQLKQNTPLLRSFLFLAQANNSEIGIMTAAETAQLNLWGTRLVVLSACETGLGDVKNGEGVYGLRRALVLAGSEAQMISLWAISDRGTQELMAEYYHRLKAGEGRSQALRNTQLKLLKDPKRRHPFYWASFIQSGEWKPL